MGLTKEEQDFEDYLDELREEIVRIREEQLNTPKRPNDPSE